AYIAEILRGAIQAVPKGEVEAAQSLGLSRATQYRKVILPRAFRIMLPAYGNEVILMLKGSALASTITLLDLMGATRSVIARTYMNMEFFLLAGVLYLLIAAALIGLFRLLERALNVHQRAPRRM
ncbi:ABC transporter permease subunit, partial [Arthrospira platensis SPKY1]|nr:ABC transporter permease subunit [Arthrospira platensis SPKY1]